MNRIGQASLFTIALIQAAGALKVREIDEDPFTSSLNFDDEEMGLEGINEDGSEALYYDPENQMIYEVTIGDEDKDEQQDEQEQ